MVFNNLLASLEKYGKSFPKEKEISDQISRFIASSPDVFHNFHWDDGHVTASLFVTNAEKTKILLMFHKKLQKWLQFGGHSDDSPDVLATAIREFYEESGIIDEPKIFGFSLENPIPIFDVDIHNIPPDAKGRPAHKHYDICFLGTISDDLIPERQVEEVDDIRWFDIENLNIDIEDAGTLRMIEKLKSLQSFMNNTLFIIDAYNLIYRMFYAIPEITTRAGEPVNAIFGVAKFLKGLAEENPDAHIVVANDVGKTFRSDIYPAYKGTRDRMPDNLRSQIEGVFAFFEAAGIQVISKDGYEADDIVGSLSHEHKNDDYQIVIISSDKDLCQFVRDGHVHIYDAMKRKFMKEKDVIEKFGVPAHQVCDYLAIVGDSSDNIPGIAGFGPKKAVDLLTKYATLEGIYENLSDLTPKMQSVLEEQKENAFLSQKLACIVTDLEIDTNSATATTMRDQLGKAEVFDFYKKYEFKSLIPANQQVIQKKLTKGIVQELKTFSEAHDFLDNLSTSEKIYFAFGSNQKIVLSSGNREVLIDLAHVDISHEVLELFERKDIQIIGYDLKEDMKHLINFQKPLIGNEGQEKLF